VNPGIPRRFGVRLLLLCAVGGLAAGCRPRAAASRGTECLAPANPGGGWDLACRTLARALTDLDLVPGAVRVTNLPGAGGGVAFAHTVARRCGDAGLVVSASPATVLRLAQGQYGRLQATDVRWIGAIATEYGTLTVRENSPLRTLEDLVAAWRRDPASVIVSGVSATAGQDHIKVMLLARAAGIDPRRIRYVPFDGGGEALAALLGGFIQVYSGDAAELLGQMEAGTVRVLTVLAPERLGGPLAAVPTAREAGYDVVWPTWRGFYAPGGLSDSVYATWVARLDSVGTSDAWAALRAQYRLEPWLVTGAAFERLVRAQVDTLRELSREIGLLR